LFGGEGAEREIALLRFALNHVGEAAFLIDQKGDFHFVNDEACSLLGYSREELLKIGIAGVDPDFFHSRWSEHWLELKEKQNLTFERSVKTKIGHSLPVEINANYFKYENTEYDFSLVRDITERKHTETMLHSLNRKLRALSDCSQALLKAGSEQSLLDDICNIICKNAGYRMAWVGYAEHDEEKTIRPVAWAGVESGYIANARLSWSADVPQGRGPAGKVVRTGETIYVQDFQTDPLMGPWRESARKHGYRSGVALPLKDEEQEIFGTLLVYSAEHDTIMPEEVSLLEELAGDLAFGIISLRARAKSKQAQTEHQQHLAFLESLERINRTLHGVENLEQMMSGVLDEVLDLLECDRAYLLYPCDPDAPTWSVPMERTRPGFPGAAILGEEVAVDQDVAQTFRTLLAAGGPVKFGPATPYPLPPEVSERFKIQSFMAMALYPKVGKPWQFGVHQCSYARVWNTQEELLFQEIGRRVSDGLTSLLIIQNLQRSEEKYRRIVDTSNEGILILDTRHLTTFINEKMAKLLGYEENEILGRPPSDFMFAEDVTDHLRKMKNRRENIGEEYDRRMIRKDGKTIWVHISATPMTNAAGEFNGSFAMMSDITKRKEAEEALKDSEWKYREIFDNVTDGLYVLEVLPDGRFRTLDVNPALERATGIPRSVSVGKTQEETVGEEIAEVVDRKYRHCVEAGHPIEEEVLLELPSGNRYFHSSLIPVRDRNGKIYRIIGISRDITEARRIENALRRSEEKYRTLIQNIEAAVVVHGADTTILESNRLAQELLGLTEEQMLGKKAIDPAWNFFLPDGAVAALDQYPVNRVIASREPLRNYILGVHRPNRPADVWVLVNADPVFDDGGELLQVIVTFSDITELQRVENELRISEERYQLAETIGHIGNWEYNIETTEFWGSDEAKRIYGFDPTQFHFSTEEVEKCIPERERVHQALIDLIEKGVPYDLEFEIRRGDTGESRTITSVAEVQPDAVGKPSKVLGVIHDITRRKEAEAALIEKENHSQSLLRLSKKLELTRSYNEVVDIAREEVKMTIGYQNLWVYLFSNDRKYAYSLAAIGDKADEILEKEDISRLVIEGDPFLEEIAQAKDIVVVEDARTDPRTDKKIVEMLGNRTIVNVPIIFFEHHLGSVGTGTYGDEGTRVPNRLEEEYLRALASHLAVTLDRIRLLIEQKNIEEKLKESEERFRLTLEAARIGIWDWDVQNDQYYTSPIYYSMLGYEPASGPTDQKTWIDGCHPDDRQMALEKIRQVTSREHNEYSYDARFRHASGEYYWIRVIGYGVQVDEGNRVTRMLGLFIDIDAQKKAEARLLRSEQRLRLHAEQSPLGFLEWDANFCAVEWNAACEKIFGYTRDEALGRHAKDLILPPEVHDLVDGIYAELMKQTGGTHSINENVTKDGRRITCEWFNTTLIDQNGKAIGVASICNDITDRMRMEEELRQYKDHLEETVQQRTAELVLARNAAETANKAKSIFLANMSHELRTPLNAILGFSRMMSMNSQLGAENLENLEIINRSGEHLLKLINDVLEMARIEAGKLQLDLAPFDLGALIRDVIEMMQVRSLEKGLRLILDQSSEFPRYIKGDESRMRQILINLLNNALKFTDQGGITLRLGIRNNDRQHLILEVEDTGCGIAKKDQERLFKPFEQISSDGNSHYGTGLGLAITRQFVEMMGGHISVESEPGKGSLFRIDLPIEVLSEKDILSREISTPGEIIGLEPGQKTIRVLIAEDQKENRLLLVRLMTGLGLDVREVENGEQCIEAFRTWQPDLIWMDRRMPVMDGIEATRRIRQLEGGNRVKIVAVTASAFIEQQQEILDAGMDDFIRKPYRFDEIYSCMAKHLAIKFSYSDALKSETPRERLTSDMFQTLPIDLILELKNALESLGTTRIETCIRKIAGIDPKLARTIQSFTANFDYPSVLDAINKTGRAE